MKNNFKSNLELAVNVLIAVSVVTVAAITVKRYLSEPKGNAPSTQGQLGVGSKINVPDVSWDTNKKTMIFFLKKDCPYCTASAPFYRGLIAEAVKRQVPVLAILPHPVQEGKDYLASINLPIDNVQTGSLLSYKIAGTPTVLLVDNTGRVIRAWLGAVAPEREEAVKSEFISSVEADAAAVNNRAAKVGGPQSSDPPAIPRELDSRELKQIMESKARIVVVDVDQRGDFKKEHIPNSINIPGDEISIRAVREIPKELSIVIYCRCKDSQATVEAQAALKEQGFTQVSVLKGGLASWKERGMAITSSE